jgi:NADH:ubiquinone oxidoreductase subunit E
MKPEKIALAKITPLIEEYQRKKWALIPLLQKVQEEYGYIPPETIGPIAEALHIFPSEVQGVVTFYSQFSLNPRGKNVIRVCKGTACHVRGGRSILKIAKRELSPPKMTSILKQYEK